MTRRSFDKIIAETAGISNADWIPLASLNRRCDFLAAHGGFEDLVHLGNAQVIASGFFTIHLVVNVVASGDAFEKCTARSLDALKRLFYLQTDILDRFELWSHYLHSDGRPNPCRDHVDAGPDGKEPRVGERRNLDSAIKLLDERFPRDGLVLRPIPRKPRSEPRWRPTGIPTRRMLSPPRSLRLEHDSRFHHAHGSRVGGRVRFSDFSIDALDLRELVQQLVLDLQILTGFGNSDPRQRDRHVKDRAFVQRRHEFRTKTLVDRDRNHNDCNGEDDDYPSQFQSRAHDRVVELHQRPADRMLLLAVNLSY